MPQESPKVIKGSRYIKLDLEWRDDPKVVLLRENHGRKAEFAWLNFMVVMAVCGGGCDLSNPRHMAIARRYMRTNEQKVRRYVEWFAEVGLIDEIQFADHAYASSTRAERERNAREGRVKWGEDQRRRREGA